MWEDFWVKPLNHLLDSCEQFCKVPLGPEALSTWSKLPLTLFITGYLLTESWVIVREGEKTFKGKASRDNHYNLTTPNTLPVKI